MKSVQRCKHDGDGGLLEVSDQLLLDMVDTPNQYGQTSVVSQRIGVHLCSHDVSPGQCVAPAKWAS